MNNNLMENYEKLKIIIDKLNELKSQNAYFGISNYCETLQLRLESLIVSNHVNKTDYLAWKKACNNLVKEIKKYIGSMYPKQYKQKFEETKTLIKELFSYYDTIYLPTTKQL